MINVELKYGKEITEGLKKLPGAVAERHLRAATKKGSDLVVEEFRRRAPVRYGRMRRTARAQRQQGGVGEAIFYVGTGAWYIRFLEYGTKKLKARRDLSESFDAKIEPAIYLIQEQLMKRIEREVKRTPGLKWRGTK